MDSLISEVLTYPLLEVELSGRNKPNVVANSLDENETAPIESSHLVLHCLQRYMCCFAGLKKLI